MILDDSLIRRAIVKLRTTAEAERDSEADALAADLETALTPSVQARLIELTEEAKRTRPTAPPAWLTEIKPARPATDGTNGLHRIVGAWPGDESDDEVAASLDHLS